MKKLFVHQREMLLLDITKEELVTKNQQFVC